MKSVISVENMRQSDFNTIASGVPSKELMLRAAIGIRKAFDYEGDTAIVVGSGNNGGDGFALAGLLADEGKNVDVYSVTDHYSEDSTYYKDLLGKKGVKIHSFTPGRGQLMKYSTLVDCLLGTGFKGEVKGIYSKAIDEINIAGHGTCAGPGSYIISVDIASGLNGDTGEGVTAVIPDMTVTIGHIKHGLLQNSISGKIICVDIGILPDHEEGYLMSSDEWLEHGFPVEKEMIESGKMMFYKEPEQGIICYSVSSSSSVNS